MKNKIKVMHYLNQFFSQIGGEEQAFAKPIIKKGIMGPGILLDKLLGDDYEIIGTIVCGDNYMADNTEKAISEIFELMDDYKPDLFIAGPAFNAGRYGPACGALCKAVKEKLSIPTITGMYKENPGVEMYKKYTYIVKTNDSARRMKVDISKMVELLKKLANKEKLTIKDTELYFARGYRKNIFVDKSGAERAVDMLLDKMNSKEFKTELRMPEFEEVKPSKPIKNLKDSKLALVTEGGIVTHENLEGLVSARANKYIEFDISDLDSLSNKMFKTIHGGFNNEHANKNPNRIVPIDILRRYEKEGIIGSIHDTLYSTSGNGTSLENSKRFGNEIAQKLLNDNVDGVILTAT